MDRQLRSRVAAIGLCLALALGGAWVSPPRTSALEPTATSPMTIVFEAGTHTGYRFSATGAILASKSYTLTRPSPSTSTARKLIAGRMHLYVSAGVWAGYWVRESMVAYLRGLTGVTSFSPARSIAFPAGTIVGYRFDSGQTMTDARAATLSRSSSAQATGTAIIRGINYFAISNGIWAGHWVPAAGMTVVRALNCRTGPRAGGTAAVLRTVSGAGAEVALTFDMGGRLDPALDIMRYLLLHGACTTIFPTGDSSQTTTGAQVLALARAYPQLFEVGNHTMYHCNLVTGGGDLACPTTRPTTVRLQQELTSAAAIIQSGSGQSPLPYWRPPFGAYDAKVLADAAAIGYTQAAMWGIDTIDWKPVSEGGPTAPQIAAKVVGGAQNGSIVLMHLGGYGTRNALPMTIHQLRSVRGLIPTSLSDLLDLR